MDQGWLQGLVSAIYPRQAYQPEDLAQLARSFFVPAHARVRPAAPLTRGTGLVLLPQNAVESARVVVTFPYPVVVTGLVASVKSATFGAFPLDLSDVLCVLEDIQAENRLTTVEPRARAQEERNAVPLDSLDARIRELMLVVDTSSEPKFGFTFRSRYADPLAQTSGLPGDATVSVTILAIPLPFWRRP